MSNDISDSQIAKNITIFFVVIAILTVVLAFLGFFIQGSEYRAQIEQETRDSLYSEPLVKEIE